MAQWRRRQRPNHRPYAPLERARVGDDPSVCRKDRPGRSSLALWTIARFCRRRHPEAVFRYRRQRRRTGLHAGRGRRYLGNSASRPHVAVRGRDSLDRPIGRQTHGHWREAAANRAVASSRATTADPACTRASRERGDVAVGTKNRVRGVASLPDFPWRWNSISGKILGETEFQRNHAGGNSG